MEKQLLLPANNAKNSDSSIIMDFEKIRKQTHDPGGTKCFLLVFQAVSITGYIGGAK